MVLTKFLTILLLTNSASSVRLDDMNADLEEDVDNMTEAQYKNYMMTHQNDEKEEEQEDDDALVTKL
jgi:hypothetical protein